MIVRLYCTNSTLCLPVTERVLLAIMAEPTVENLIHDLLEWLAKEERSYGELMDAWRTSCPRLPVWEEASDRGLVMRDRS